MREDVRTKYECSACGAASGVTVLGVEVPDALPHHLHRELEEVVSENRVAQLSDEKRRAAAAAELRFATCPRRSARNPEGVVEARRRAWWVALGGTIFYGALGAGAAFAPSLVLVVPAMVLLGMVKNVVLFARSQPGRTLAISAVHVGVVVTVVAIWWWRLAWAPFVFVACVAESWRSALSIRGQWFEHGTRQLRFDPDATAYRG
jgi:hypothetical protein